MVKRCFSTVLPCCFELLCRKPQHFERRVVPTNITFRQLHGEHSARWSVWQMLSKSSFWSDCSNLNGPTPVLQTLIRSLFAFDQRSSSPAVVMRAGVKCSGGFMVFPLMKPGNERTQNPTGSVVGSAPSKEQPAETCDSEIVEAICPPIT